jgi:hypothetical protein
MCYSSLHRRCLDSLWSWFRNPFLIPVTPSSFWKEGSLEKILWKSRVSIVIPFRSGLLGKMTHTWNHPAVSWNTSYDVSDKVLSQKMICQITLLNERQDSRQNEKHASSKKSVRQTQVSFFTPVIISTDFPESIFWLKHDQRCRDTFSSFYCVTVNSLMTNNRKHNPINSRRRPWLKKRDRFSKQGEIPRIVQKRKRWKMKQKKNSADKSNENNENGIDQFK